MFRQSSDAEFQGRAEGGTRHLFRIDSFEFFDVIDDEGVLHHFVLEHIEDDETAAYEVDRHTMYEFMARYMAGEFEKRQYNLSISPTHQALLDALEMALAGARSGETDFTFDDLDDTDFDLDLDLDSEGVDGEEGFGDGPGSAER
jgi:hypothetical protein